MPRPEEHIAERDAAISKWLIAAVVMALIGVAAPSVASGFRFLAHAIAGRPAENDCPHSTAQLAPDEQEIERRRCEAEKAGAGRDR